MIRVFPVKNKWTPTDSLAFIGEPPLFRPADRKIPVRVSVTFTWDIDEAERIAGHWEKYYDDVRVGGPAYDSPAGEFVPGLFMKEGCVITTRGCPKKCPWCVVPAREGQMTYIPVNDGWILQDNNILAADPQHVEKVFSMLRRQTQRVYFTGGLDKHFLKPWHVELFLGIRLGELWFACDIARDIPALRRVVEMIDGRIPARKMRCYTMIGFGGETVAEARDRCEAVYRMGFLPFAQLFQPMERNRIEYDREWHDLQRFWSRPAIYRSQTPVEGAA